MTVTTSQRSVRPAHGARPTPERIAQLVRGAASGDPASWECLVSEFSSMIWSVARAHRLSEADAADVVQTTWLRLLDHLDGLEDPSRVGAWLATSARRECLKILRLAQRQVAVGDELPEAPSPEAGPDERLLRTERQQALQRAFACLRESDQALLRMLVAEPAPSYEEISAALGMPIGSIGPTRARALARLRESLDRDGALSLVVA